MNKTFTNSKKNANTPYSIRLQRDSLKINALKLPYPNEAKFLAPYGLSSLDILKVQLYVLNPYKNI